MQHYQIHCFSICHILLALLPWQPIRPGFSLPSKRETRKDIFWQSIPDSETVKPNLASSYSIFADCIWNGHISISRHIQRYFHICRATFLASLYFSLYRNVSHHQFLHVFCIWNGHYTLYFPEQIYMYMKLPFAWILYPKHISSCQQ